MSKSTQGPQSLDDLLNAIQKQAEAGEGNPPTTHPTGGPMDNIQESTTGARSAEHSKDLKDLVETADAEHNSATPGGGEDSRDTITTNPKSTGNEPAVERSHNDRPYDPGTTHPANASVGPKYSDDRMNKVAASTAAFLEHGNRLLAEMVAATEKDQPSSKQASKQSDGKTSTIKEAESEEPLAEGDQELLKAAYDLSCRTVFNIRKDAQAHALNYIDFLATKRAMEEEYAEGDDDDDDDDGSDDGESADADVMPGSEGEGMSGEGGMVSPDAMGGGAELEQLAALLGGGGMGGGMGGDMEGMGGGMEGMGGDPSMDQMGMEELQAIADELGVPVEQVAQEILAKGAQAAIIKAASAKLASTEVKKVADSKTAEGRLRNALRDAVREAYTAAEDISRRGQRQ